MRSRKVHWMLLAAGVLMACVLAIGLLWYGFVPRFGHQHCIVQIGLALSQYAENHSGQYPYHPNGFGDALLLLLREEDYLSVAPLCGPGDDGTVLTGALHDGTDVPEDACSRVYIQGLSRANHPDICLLFDRSSSPGGDHFRAPWRPLVREVWMLGAGMEVIREEKWPEFSNQQVDLLVAAGLPQEQALEYYPAAQRR